MRDLRVKIGVLHEGLAKHKNIINELFSHPSILFVCKHNFSLTYGNIEREILSPKEVSRLHKHFYIVITKFHIEVANKNIKIIQKMVVTYKD